MNISIYKKNINKYLFIVYIVFECIFIAVSLFKGWFFLEKIMNVRFEKLFSNKKIKIHTNFLLCF